MHQQDILVYSIRSQARFIFACDFALRYASTVGGARSLEIASTSHFPSNHLNVVQYHTVHYIPSY